MTATSLTWSKSGRGRCCADGTVICASHSTTCCGAFDQRLRKRSKESFQAVFRRYERHRRRVVETRAVNALRAGFEPGAETGVFYEVVEDGEEKRPEIDGLLRLDSALVVVEAKGSSMRPSARRGAPAALHDWLRNEVSRAGSQARRARNVLLSSDPPELTDADGEPLQRQLAGLNECYELVVVSRTSLRLAPRPGDLPMQVCFRGTRFRS